jgi:putative flippase GtrA
VHSHLEQDGGAAADGGVAQSLRTGSSLEPRSGVLRFLLHRRVRFVGAGAINTAFAFLVFAALQTTLGGVVNYMIILLFAHVIGVLEAFTLYRLTVFRVRGRILLDLARFESVYLLALGINAALLPLLVELGHVPVILAQGVIVTFTAVVSYVGHKHFSFRRPREIR